MDGIERLGSSDFHSPETIISQPSQLSRHNSQLDFTDNSAQLAQALQTQVQAQVTSLFSNGDVNSECSGLPDGGLTSSEGLGNFIQSLAQTMVNAGMGGVLSVSTRVCGYQSKITERANLPTCACFRMHALIKDYAAVYSKRAIASKRNVGNPY